MKNRFSVLGLSAELDLLGTKEGTPTGSPFLNAPFDAGLQHASTACTSVRTGAACLGTQKQHVSLLRKRNTRVHVLEQGSHQSGRW